MCSLILFVKTIFYIKQSIKEPESSKRKIGCGNKSRTKSTKSVSILIRLNCPKRKLILLVEFVAAEICKKKWYMLRDGFWRYMSKSAGKNASEIRYNQRRLMFLLENSPELATE